MSDNLFGFYWLDLNVCNSTTSDFKCVHNCTLVLISFRKYTYIFYKYLNWDSNVNNSFVLYHMIKNVLVTQLTCLHNHARRLLSGFGCIKDLIAIISTSVTSLCCHCSRLSSNEMIIDRSQRRVLFGIQYILLIL